MRRNNVTHQSAQNEDCYNRKVIFQNYERINEKIDNLFNMYSKEKTQFDLRQDVLYGNRLRNCTTNKIMPIFML